ncbi:BLOC-1 related complex subunit 7 [Tachypleus tridentatus]|uniref:BLOC-1 related complex subunit 7 n=1 Tax=Tachypleus tridentatus TaxID=6853 RepID=UPI003FD5D240
MAASSTPGSARNLFIESKARLSERIQVNVNSVGSLARQVTKGSKTSEILMHTARNFALQEYAMDNMEVNLKRMELLATHLQLQLDAIERSAHVLDDVKEQLLHLHC